MKKICVLQPDYSTTEVDYKNYDPPRCLSPLLPGCKVDHVFLNKLSTYQKLKELKKKNYDVFVNLCEGYLDWSVPSIDVIYSLELLNLPYTGPSMILYDPPKEVMKYAAYCCGVNSPAYVKANADTTIAEITAHLHFPLFIKPAKAGDSLGIDENSLVQNEQELSEKLSTVLINFEEVLVEEFVDGREFTVLVAADAGCGGKPTVYPPLEFVFPESKKYKTYSLKTSDLHKESNIPCTDEHLSDQLKDATSRIFMEFNGVGYARLDFRVNAKKEIFFLEINFTCSVFYENGFEGSADYILMNAPGGKKAFLEHIISEGIYRHQQKQKKYLVKGNSISGYGIYANKNLEDGEVIFNNEGKPHRIISKKYVEENWNDDEIRDFRKYAWPLNETIYVLWDEDACQWAPQNHSCNPNTHYCGLNLIASGKIAQGEELTLDYETFLNSDAESFICNCGSPNCKIFINGKDT